MFATESIYFITTLFITQNDAEAQIVFVIQKMKCFDKFKDQLTERQLKAVKRILDKGSDGFSGGMNATKYFACVKHQKQQQQGIFSILAE